MATTIGATVKLDGEREFKAAASSINTALKTMGTEFARVSSQFDAGDKSVQKLSEQNRVLNDTLEEQKKKVDIAREALENAKREYGETDRKTQSWQQTLNRAETQVNNLTRQIDENKQSIINQGGAWSDTATKIQNAGDKMQAVGSKLNSVGNTLSLGLTTPILGAGIAAGKAAIDFEHAFTSVRKTIDATEEELDTLKSEISDMAASTGQSVEEISGVAAAAGQLGIETENIIGFTKAMVDMGVSTNLTSETAAISLAKFANITKMSQKDFDRLGSAVVALGNNFATQEDAIVEMGLRLAGAGAQVGLTEGEIMGLATALSSVGIEAEAGGSAFSKVMTQMQVAVETGDESLQNFAEVAGMTAGEFKTAFENDAGGAIAKFIQGLGDTDSAGKSTILMLQEMGLTEVRLRDSLTRLAGNSDLLTDALDIGNQAWRDNNALTKEANAFYGDTTGKINQAKESIKAAARTTVSSLMPAIADIADGVADAAKSFAELSPEAQKTILVITGITAAAGPAAKALGGITKAAGATVKGVSGVVRGIGGFAAASRSGLGVMQSLRAGFGAMTGAATNSAAAVGSAASGLTGMASLAGPVGIAIAGTTAVIAGIGIASYNASQYMRDFSAAYTGVANGMSEFQSGIASGKSALEGFNMETIISSEKMQEYENKITTAKDNIHGIAEKAASESRELTNAERREIESLVNMIEDYTTKKLDAYEQQQKVVAAMADSEKNMTEQRAQELLKAAQEAYDQMLIQADTHRMDMTAIAIKQKEEGTITEEEYQKQLDDAQKYYNDAKAKAESHYGETAAIVADSYYQQNLAESEFVKKSEDLLKQIELLEAQRQDIMARSSQDVRYAAESKKALKEVNKQYKEAMKELTEIMDEESQNQVGAWMSMVGHAEIYGKEISEESQKTANNVISAFEKLPADAREAFQDAMDGALKGLEDKEPELYDKAAKIADTIIARIRKVFDVHSPSRVMRKLFQNVWAGAEIATDDAAENLAKQAETVSGGIIDKIRKTGTMIAATGIKASQLAQRILPQSAATTKTGLQSGAGGDTVIQITGPVNINDGTDIDAFANRLWTQFARLQQQDRRARGMA